MPESYPILEYSSERESIINPYDIIKPVSGIPIHCVLSFFNNTVKEFAEKGLAEEIAHLYSETGSTGVYKVKLNESYFVLVHPGVGAPLSAACLEEVISLGCRKFVVCGAAGVLDRKITPGKIIVPTSAMRDEGTSYHYIPPGKEALPSARAMEAVQSTLVKHEIDYLPGKTWTTDGVYRETKERFARRKSEGCLTVEMEAAALFAVAKFRGVELAQILYAGDNLDSDKWEPRGWNKNNLLREKLIWLSAEACLLL